MSALEKLANLNKLVAEISSLDDRNIRFLNSVVYEIMLERHLLVPKSQQVAERHLPTTDAVKILKRRYPRLIKVVNIIDDDVPTKKSRKGRKSGRHFVHSCWRTSSRGNPFPVKAHYSGAGPMAAKTRKAKNGPLQKSLLAFLKENRLSMEVFHKRFFPKMGYSAFYFQSTGRSKTPRAFRAAILRITSKRLTQA